MTLTVSYREIMNTLQACFRYYCFFACGDAVGKATEFMTPQDIKRVFGSITSMPDISRSITHSDLPQYAATDDTEQNLWLFRRYRMDRNVTIENTVDELLKWIDGTNAVEKHYIGPSSLKALQGIKNGEDPLKAGINGTTCGGIMRVPAAVFASRLLNLDLDTCVYNALVCTHNNSIALESAYAYAYALSHALDNPGCSTRELLDKAKEGCRIGLSKAPWISAGASLLDRLIFLEKMDLCKYDEQTFKSFIYGVLGTGLPSYETASAVFALNLFSQDPQKIMFLAAELGGDTDTIGALACSLACLRNLEVPLPAEFSEDVIFYNRLGEYLGFI